MARKLCSKCKRWKSLRSFYRQARSKDGLMGRCKQCFLEAQATAAARRRGEDRPLRKQGNAVVAGKTVLSPYKETDWKYRAACRDQAGDWVEVTAKNVQLQREEKFRELAYCEQCEVRAECLEYGLREPTAIFGGLMPKERRDLVNVSA